MLICSCLHRKPPAEKGISGLKVLSYLGINPDLIPCAMWAAKRTICFFQISMFWEL